MIVMLRSHDGRDAAGGHRKEKIDTVGITEQNSQVEGNF